MKKSLTKLSLAALMALGLGVTGCSSSTPAGDSSETSSEDQNTNTNDANETGDADKEDADSTGESDSNTADSGEIVVEHALGETVLEETPQRVVTIGWENQDTPLALGVAPVAVSKANYGTVGEHGLHPWTEEAYAKLGDTDFVVFDDTDGLDYEGIADAEPDVILAAYSGITQEEYDRLSEIAPVVAYPEAPWQTLWRDQTLLDAAGIGQKEAGEELVKETEDLIAEKTAEYPDIKGKKAAFFWITPDDLSTFFVYTPNDPRAAYLVDLGLEFPDSVAALKQSADDFNVVVSRENADQLSDVEMIVTYGDENTLKALQDDPLMSQIPAVKNGAVVLIDENSDLAGGATPSILSIPWNIDTYLELINEAAAKVQ